MTPTTTTITMAAATTATTAVAKMATRFQKQYRNLICFNVGSKRDKESLSTVDKNAQFIQRKDMVRLFYEAEVV